ncbi:MAG: 5'-nucleotidase C-terminal domain-containing protein [Pseudomonadota bacterium]|nr:5'-nucleotidase C-terminal domain-containing protein [Pseudomonadota bacterium]
MAIRKIFARARLKTLRAALLAAAAGVVPSTVLAGSGEVTLIQTGDIHGHLVARPNLRSDSIGHSMEGGVARMYTLIKKLRKEAREKGVDHSLLINTGDTVQGSGEALFSRGQVMVDVLNKFGYVAHAPGNWDFLYGTARFEETFKGTPATATTPAVPPLANWNALGSNLYYTNQFDDAAVCGATAIDPATGTLRPLKRVLPTYSIKQVGKVKIGILGFTTARAIAAVGTSVTQNYLFTDAKTEVPCFVNKLRNDEKVDVVVMISELEMARDIEIAEKISPAPDVILNSDMHERTTEPIVVSHADGTQTLILEQGQDGTVVGELELEIKNGKIKEWEFKQHVVTDDLKEDKAIAALVAQVRAPYVAGTFVPGQKVTIGGNTTELLRPVDEAIAYTEVGLHRSNFVDEDMPAVVEGTSHNLIADAMTAVSGAESSSIRGFRYGTHVPAGWPITMEDIYHYVPIAAKLGRTTKACGADLKFAIEQSTQGTFASNPTLWAGGWMFGYNGVSFDVDACDGLMGATPAPINGPTLALPTRPWGTNRGSNIKVNGAPLKEMDIYDSRATIAGVTNPTYQQCLSADGGPAYAGYKVAGYWFADDKTTINNCNPCRGRQVQVVKTDGTVVQVAGPGAPATLPPSEELMDVSEAVVQYLRVNLGGTVTEANLPIHRLNVKRLPTINPPGYHFKMIQPLKGASAETCPVL